MLSLRKDVQMGLVIGAIVLSVVGVYIVLSAIAGAGAKQVAGAELVTDPNAGKLAASVTPVQANPQPKQPTGTSAGRNTAAPAVPASTPPAPVETAVAEPADPTPPARGNDPWANFDFSSSPRTTLTSNPQPATEPQTPAAPVVVPVVPATPGSAQQYVIEAGDTFSSISQKFYGDAKHFDLLVKANPNVNPGRMKPGTAIMVPPLPAKAAAAATDDRADVSVALIDPTKQYEVQPGDNLNKISLKLYGTSQKWNAIYQLNKRILGEDATKLKPGMVLSLPESPTLVAR